MPLFLMFLLTVLYANSQCCTLSADCNLMRDSDELSVQEIPYFILTPKATISFGTSLALPTKERTTKYCFRRIRLEETLDLTMTE